jgi:chromate reductase
LIDLTKRIGFMLGSLRKEAFTRKVAAQLAELFPEEFEIVFPEIGHLEMYNRSVPPVLKNALDIASRPYGANAWNDKPGAIVSVSPGAVSGFGANHHLRQVLTFLNIHAMAQPEAYIGSVMNLINEDGTFKEDTVNFFQIIVDSYVAWFNRLEK